MVSPKRTVYFTVAEVSCSQGTRGSGILQEKSRIPHRTRARPAG